jgi:hypothetical protein
MIKVKEAYDINVRAVFEDIKEIDYGLTAHKAQHPEFPRYPTVHPMIDPRSSAGWLVCVCGEELDGNILTVTPSPRLEDKSITTRTKLCTELIFGQESRVEVVAFREARRYCSPFHCLRLSLKLRKLAGEFVCDIGVMHWGCEVHFFRDRAGCRARIRSLHSNIASTRGTYAEETG